MPSVYTTSREHFEQRMRARRAATCLAVARSAIASGRMTEAIERLEEACSLDSDAGEARLLLEELRLQEAWEPEGDAEAVVSVHHGGFARWSHWLAAGIAIGVLAGLAYVWPDGKRETGTHRSLPARQEAPAIREKWPSPGDALPPGLVARLGVPVPTSGDAEEVPPVAPSQEIAQGTQSVSIQVKEQPVTTTLPIVASSGTLPSPAAPAPASPSPVTQTAALQPAAPDRERVMESSGTATMPAVSGVVATLPPPQPPAPPLERVAVAVEDPKPAPVVDAAPATASSNAPSSPAVEPAAAKVNETGEIEQTLGRYADAYARLDARAARAVWPTVDQRALARAFEGLESQGIFFEHCDVMLAGVDATAACRGRAQYVPKVGSREPQVQRRQWTFKLHKADNGWQIVQAEAR